MAPYFGATSFQGAIIMATMIPVKEKTICLKVFEIPVCFAFAN